MNPFIPNKVASIRSVPLANVPGLTSPFDSETWNVIFYSLGVGCQKWLSLNVMDKVRLVRQADHIHDTIQFYNIGAQYDLPPSTLELSRIAGIDRHCTDFLRGVVTEAGLQRHYPAPSGAIGDPTPMSPLMAGAIGAVLGAVGYHFLGR